MEEIIPPLAVWANKDDPDEEQHTVVIVLDKVQAYMLRNALLAGSEAMHAAGYVGNATYTAKMADEFGKVFKEVGGTAAGLALFRKRERGNDGSQ